MNVERGLMGPLSWAAVGTGRPVVVLAGVSPNTGVDGGFMVRSVLAPVLPLSGTRRLYALNRWHGMPEDLSMARLASEHADAFRTAFDEPVDLVGVSTGGSIAQQIAAEHPDVVRRLVLISTGCRLEPGARAEQRAVATLLRSGRTRAAAGLLVTDVVPPWLHRPARAVGWVIAPWMLGGRTSRADLATTLEAEDDFDLAALPPITAPTLIVGGAADRFYSAEVFRETAELIPGASLLLVPRRGHLGVVTDKSARAQVARFLS